MQEKTVYPAALSGRAAIPASKSQTVRALLIAALAAGSSIIRNPLDSGDTRACLAAVTAFGARVDTNEGVWEVTGINAPLPPRQGGTLTVDVGNSGTTLYLGMGAALHLGIPVIFTGDGQIRQRPVADLVGAYQDLGAITCIPDQPDLAPPLKPGSPPCCIAGPLRGGRTEISCPTSQYLSSLLLSCPLGQGESVIEVPLLYEHPYVDMTLQWLDEQGIAYRREGYRKFTIPGGQHYRSFTKHIAGDFSSASFFFCAAAVTASVLTVSGLDVHDVQGDREILSFLESMGCAVTWLDDHTLTISGPPRGELHGGEFDLNALPDALPALAAAACFASGTTRLVNVPQARIKETDRIAVMHRELEKLGARIEELDDGLVIRGTGGLSGGYTKGYGDHRVIMALAVAGLGADGPVTIDDTSAADITFPGFFSLLDEVSTGR